MGSIWKEGRWAERRVQHELREDGPGVGRRKVGKAKLNSRWQMEFSRECVCLSVCLFVFFAIV